MKTKLIIRVGLITGVLSAALVQLAFALLDLLNIRLNWGIPLSQIRGISGIFSFVFLGIGIYIGMKKTRNINGGTLTWPKAVLTGVIIALITGLVSALGALIFNYFNPDFADRMVRDVASMPGPVSDTITNANEPIRQKFSPAMLVVQAFAGQLFGGTIISLVMAIFLKRTHSI